MEKLTYEQWVEKYNPLKNHFTDAPYEGFAFETFGEELEFVKKFQNCFIWTAINCDNEETWIVPGYHFVDRYLYFITHNPWENENIQVNDNEMISVGKAKYSCLEFLDEIGIELTPEQEDILHNFFSQF